jgi:hypothetical protein
MKSKFRDEKFTAAVKSEIYRPMLNAEMLQKACLIGMHPIK